MSEHTRRTVLRTAAATGAGLSLTGAAAGSGAAAAATAGSGAGAAAHGRRPPPPLGPVRAGPDDPRYEHLVSRGQGTRFKGSPDLVYVVGSTRQVVRAVNESVRAGRRLAVRSGGHCFEDFVDHPDIRVVIDMSGMTQVYYDPHRDAFAVEAGATLAEVYRRLHLGWGVTVPAGWCPEVGAGGHVPGGGYGPLCRLYGLAVDYLYAVEVVVVDRRGRARAVVATREADDPNRELWWAHTGGGGGNFGVVTRYWFRDLPSPPATVLSFTAEWSWEGMDREAFARMVRGHGRWAERHSGSGAAEAALYSEFILFRRQLGAHRMAGQVAAGPGTAERLLRGHLEAIGADGGVRPSAVRTRRLPWLTAALEGTGEDGSAFSQKIKSGYARKGLTGRQIEAVHRHLTRADVDVPGGMVSLNTYGGRVNDVAPSATAAAHRDSVLKLTYMASWEKPEQEARHLAWIREFYRDVYADTGGVPAPGPVDDGAFISYPDVDLADPRWNASGVPWSELYYKDGYRRLRRAKARWDPRGVFRHALSVEPV
ncbi:FAD-binding oxidoreductase [Streptomyces sp. PR69]|uniref:FAD-binding oxidoreductase n=1 Tax=Streptomyces sp. PR69 TaxID=2984950 RepID=UPI0022653560|nr:FAD-binding protein [Streptomyces sp. PR69]